MSFKINIFLLISFLSASLTGQDIDSLLIKLKPLPDGKERVDVLNAIVTKMRERNIYEAVKYGTEAKELAENLEYQKGSGLALENLGWIYYRRGIYSDAFDLSQQALKISEEQGDSIAIARCLNNVAAINYEKEQYAEAIAKFREAYRISSRLGDAETSVRSLNNVSFSFFALANYDSAEYYALKALENSKEHRQNYLPAFSYRILGDIACAKSEYSEALRYLSESMRISEATNNYFIQASTLHRIGKVYARQKKYNQALEILNRNVELSKKNGYADELERTYKLIYEINESRNNIDQALEYLSRHLAIHDSLINQRSSERLELLSAQFESELKQSQIELLTQNAKIKEEEINRQKLLSYFYVGGIILVLIMGATLYYSNQRIKKINIELQNKTEQVGMQAAQLSSINKTKDKMLSIISHDIRSPLSSLRGMLNIAQTGNVTKDEFGKLTSRISNQLDSVYEDLGNLLRWTQTQLQGLVIKPETVQLNKITDEMLLIFSDTAKEKNVILRSEIKSGVEVLVDPNHLRLILRNLISNAIKFSYENGEVSISNAVNGSFVTVSICDKGTGLNKEDISKLFTETSHFTRQGTSNEKGMGVGLLLTKEFIEKNGGSVEVVSEPGAGSTFSFTLRKAT